jgi:CRP-like cAMP-binding protein
VAALAEADFTALRPHLKPVDLPQGAVLYEIGASIHQVYFPHSGIVSLVVDLASGDIIESAMIGRESLVGASSGLNGQVSVCKAIVQIAGTATALDSHRLRGLADTSTACRTTLFRHEQLVLVQAQQSAACNATHTIEARLARWLLRCRDLQGSDELLLTQEFISEMLGVRRTSVSVVASRRGLSATPAATSAFSIWKECKRPPASATRPSRRRPNGCSRSAERGRTPD